MPEFSEDLTLMRKVGCEACEGQGYSGRIAIQELLVNSPEIKRAIKYNSKVEEISDIAISQGMRNLRMDGIQKIFQGLTDLHQVNQVYI
jgi:type II secretory ATPase GspE/PulE/Tfp pilus assembly ATPase PilB-like protein